ncbi:HEAT repeat domain-containing protein, partial [bacterium]|nr:HEAT repeat domain-containing protein [bacterium]
MAENRDTIIIGTRLINSTKEESFKEGIEILGRNTSQTVINTLKQIADSKSNKKKRDYARKALNRIANRLRLDSWKDFFEKADHLQKKINNKLEHYETKKEKALKIVKVLYSENNCFVIASLIKQIGDFKDPFFLPVILKYLNHKDPRVRANTVEALESINDFGNKVIKSLVARLVDESGRVKANTLKLLAKLNIIDIEEGLTYMLEKGD